MADASAAALCADAEVTAYPENFYDRIIEIDLDALEPYLKARSRPTLPARSRSLPPR